ncbi:MAG: sulfurtransferase [Sphingobacteriia bacterium]|nr:sulfurtransferase [Sphingobacteriia bacterium]
MKSINRILGLFLLVVLSTGAWAQFDIISAKEAVKLVDDENTIIISTRKAEDYAKVHIKNAINVEMKSLYQEGPIEGLLKGSAEMAKILGNHGVDPSKNIIIYDNGKYVYATYMYWILDYLGYPNVKVLDGHMTGWRAARGPVTKTPSTRPALTVTPKVKTALFCDYNCVKGKLDKPGTIIVDVQSPKEYEAGHIPGAINMENKLFFNEDTSTLKEKAEIEKVLANHNITKDKEIILYCASSARTGTVYLAMKALGYKNMKIYEGGWNEYKTK